MRTWDQSTFVFLSTNPENQPGGVEENWLAVMSALVKLGAAVEFACVADSRLAEPARTLGVTVAPYVLDKWNVVRSRSRLRKYLQRYDPVCAHSTGTEADLLLRWAVRKLPQVRIATTLTRRLAQPTRRRRPIDTLMRRFDDTGIERTDAIFVPTPELAAEVIAEGLPPDRVILDPPAPDPAASVGRHIAVYRGLMAQRGLRG